MTYFQSDKTRPLNQNLINANKKVYISQNKQSLSNHTNTLTGKVANRLMCRPTY